LVEIGEFLSRDFEGMMEFFREFPTGVNSEVIMKVSFSLPLKRAHIDQARYEAKMDMGLIRNEEEEEEEDMI